MALKMQNNSRAAMLQQQRNAVIDMQKSYYFLLN